MNNDEKKVLEIVGGIIPMLKAHGTAADRLWDPNQIETMDLIAIKIVRELHAAGLIDAYERCVKDSIDG